MTAVAMNTKTDVMKEIEPEVYASESGYTARREHGLTPNGNPIAGRWVLRDDTGAWVDFDQYRHDLFCHHALKPDY